jgi:hypothetical protein
LLADAKTLELINALVRGFGFPRSIEMEHGKPTTERKDQFSMKNKNKRQKVLKQHPPWLQEALDELRERAARIAPLMKGKEGERRRKAAMERLRSSRDNDKPMVARKPPAQGKNDGVPDESKDKQPSPQSKEIAMTKEIKIYYNSRETGWAQVLHGRVARIDNTPFLSPKLCRNAIVLLDQDPKYKEGFPKIAKVLYSPYPKRTFLSFEDDM